MADLSFDELNKRNGGAVKKSSKKAVPFKEYFGIMGLSKKAQELRFTIATDLVETLLYLYALKSEGATNSLASAELLNELLGVYSKHGEVDEYIEEMSKQYADNLSKTTVSADDEDDQAMFIAEDMANAYANYLEYQDAVKSGKTKKQWITEGDNLVRPSHQDEEGVVVDINDTFNVGGSIMRFPKDTYYGASDEEIIRCRCTIKYI